MHCTLYNTGYSLLSDRFYFIQRLFTSMTKLSNPYIIAFAGLKNGEHHYNYVIDDAFFKNRDYSEVKQGNVNTHVVLIKETNLLVFDIKMEGFLNVTCDRCGDPFNIPVWGEKKLIATLTNDRFEEDDDIVSISIHTSEIDISQYLYEYVSLLLPQRHIHPDKEGGTNGCNSDSLKLLDKFSHPDSVKNDFIDPRWDALRKIKKTN